MRLYEWDATALPAVQSWLDEVLDHVDVGARARLAGTVVEVDVIPKNLRLTDLSGWTQYEGEEVPDDPDGRTYDEMRGFTVCETDRLLVAVGEERLVSLPGTPNPSPSVDELGYTLAHELGHAIECRGLSSSQQTVLSDLHRDAVDRVESGDLADIIGFDPAYTVSNEGEFFAEATAAWFDFGNSSDGYRRAWLADHDPDLYELLDQVFTLPPAPRYCEDERATTVIRSVGGTVERGPGRDVIAGSGGSDTIRTTGGSGLSDLGLGDLVCGAGGDDDIRTGSDDDAVYGGLGDDALYGGSGDDQIYGGLENDTYIGQAGDDDLVEAIYEGDGGEDNMYGGPGDDHARGGREHDVIRDDTGEDELIGGSEDDYILAVDLRGDIADYIDGDQGTDTCRVDPNDAVFNCP